VGTTLGLEDGEVVGLALGTEVGTKVGDNEGWEVVGMMLGDAVGNVLGVDVVTPVGATGPNALYTVRITSLNMSATYNTGRPKDENA
jgi:hypothetical protein